MSIKEWLQVRNIKKINKYYSDELETLYLSENLKIGIGKKHISNVFIAGQDIDRFRWMCKNIEHCNGKTIVISSNKSFLTIYKAILEKRKTETLYIQNTDVLNEAVEFWLTNDNDKYNVDVILVDVLHLTAETGKNIQNMLKQLVYEQDKLPFTERNRHIQIYIDDIAELPTIPGLESMVNTDRPFNIGICLLTKSFSALREKYCLCNEILFNCSAIVNLSMEIFLSDFIRMLSDEHMKKIKKKSLKPKDYTKKIAGTEKCQVCIQKEHGGTFLIKDNHL